MTDPKEVFDIFSQINQIPRPSKHEQKISRWLQDFAAGHKIECIVDDAMNVVMRVPATPGYEDHPGVILQAHQDMVCEKDADCTIDFMNDPIRTVVDGDWMHAQGTTLGADDGIGISMALAALTSPDVKHPALEALFTVDEETGLTGANRLQEGILQYRRLINLDNEDDGKICIGCAGGIDSLGKMHYTPVQLPEGKWLGLKLRVDGLPGGHSGEDINKGRANANKVLTYFLTEIFDSTDMYLAAIHGGNLRNAIAREAEAVVCVPFEDRERLRVLFNDKAAQVEAVYQATNPNIRCEMQTTALPDEVMSLEDTSRLLATLTTCPHGMIRMCADIPDLVETSTNLASVHTGGQPLPNGQRLIEINTSQRSSIEAQKHQIKRHVEYALSIACDEVTHGDGYPGWAPNVHSPLLDTIVATYKQLYKSEPEVLAIHAGLECGLFLTKYPDMDMVSVGPQMYDVHSPKERLSISSTAKTWQWLKATLAAL
ncbi:MAG: aminoacyl-histidine dipeptidase [Paludibacteraceae bacterium]|nr:aminoacyl-histidine dipeptidase [Paludibacteraceae bacterium]